MFNGPIPGESLTREPGNAPWEQPPQYETVDKALNFYMSELEENDELLEDTLYILDQDFPLDLFVESLLLNGEMNGKHSFDVSFLIAPVLHEHLLSLAEAAGVKVREFQGKSSSDKARDKTINDLKIILGNPQAGVTGQQTAEVLDEAEAKLEEQQGENSPYNAPKKGLMSRRG